MDGKAYTPPSDPQVADAVRAVLANEGVKKTLLNLTNAIRFQQGNATGKSSGPLHSEYGFKDKLKANKLKIVALAKALPDEVRAAIELPKSDIAGLTRGVRDRSITETDSWKNGSFVYGFTKNATTAKSYTSKYSPESRVIGANDIESFGGIIDVQKVWDFATEVNRAIWGDDTTWVKNGSLSYPKNPKYNTDESSPINTPDYRTKYKEYSANSIPEAYNAFKFEEEVFVYDIKFKKNGDKFYS